MIKKDASTEEGCPIYTCICTTMVCISHVTIHTDHKTCTRFVKSCLWSVNCISLEKYFHGVRGYDTSTAHRSVTVQQ